MPCCPCPTSPCGGALPESATRALSRSKCGFTALDGSSNKRWIRRSIAYATSQSISFVSPPDPRGGGGFTGTAVDSGNCTINATEETINEYNLEACLDGATPSFTSSYSGSGTINSFNNTTITGECEAEPEPTAASYTYTSSESGAWTRNPTTGAWTYAGNLRLQIACEGECLATGDGCPSTDTTSPTGGASPGPRARVPCEPTSLGCNLLSATGTPTEANWVETQTIGNGPLGGSCPGSGTVVKTTTLENEFTTALLTDGVRTRLNALPYSAWSTTLGAATRNLSANELTYSLQDWKYRWRIAVSPRCRTLIRWREQFTPENGDPPTYTERVLDYTHTGTPRCYGEDYDPADPSTWPLSAEYTVPAPATDGTTIISEWEAICLRAGDTPPPTPWSES